ncbi:uncharacterized protein BO97DRAFT_405552 [Aspergillus homomorphus CBS 101889]|uniref:Secreted protein n=1 Tax=Aspergillus homomorphus (strain CBS 101889) TaxID=1450537 RepID=A0A395HZ92_ASPHC|nr:hypothetical protein BO97DRAFT_405552 [Aspergillus homomorphus CBS 101889]RAL12188.1 hypothetical protein BO97DRAFT_405552 [Aspergillus homomorphus CBS 101889]
MTRCYMLCPFVALAVTMSRLSNLKNGNDHTEPCKLARGWLETRSGCFSVLQFSIQEESPRSIQVMMHLITVNEATYFHQLPGTYVCLRANKMKL